MSASQETPREIKGLSFSIADLTLLRAWAQANALRMVINLDHGLDVEEFEEVLAFHGGDNWRCKWIMWRDATTVFVQPLIGRTDCFKTVADAFEAWAAKQPILTDIKASKWPT